MLLKVKRWLPKREIIAVGDSSYAAIGFLAAIRGHLTMTARLRLGASFMDLPLKGFQAGLDVTERKEKGCQPYSR